MEIIKPVGLPSCNFNGFQMQGSQYGWQNGHFDFQQGDQFVRHSTGRQIKFGTLDPVTTSHLLSEAGKIIGEVLLGKSVKSILFDSEKLQKVGNLSQSVSYKDARTHLELAERAARKKEKLEYLHKAQQDFSHAANSQHYHILAAECWKYAALCAKTGERSQSTVDYYCEQAASAFDKSRAQILEERQELLNPFKPGNMPRLLLASPLSALVTPHYVLSHKGTHFSNSIRSDLITYAYGSDELARVRQNESLAERFNGASDLLKAISNLHSYRTWSFNASSIPKEVPMMTDKVKRVSNSVTQECVIQ